MDVMGVETMIQKTAYWLCLPYSYTLLYAGTVLRIMNPRFKILCIDVGSTEGVADSIQPEEMLSCIDYRVSYTQ